MKYLALSNNTLNEKVSILETEVQRLKETLGAKSLVVYAGANPSTAGYVGGSGSYILEDGSFLITAYPASGTEYYISSVSLTYASGSSETIDQATLINRGWLTNGEKRLDMTIPISASMLDDTLDVVVNFGLPTRYNLTLNVDPTGSGTVTGSGLYEPDSYVTIRAVANSGWKFAGWYENGSLVYPAINDTINIYLTSDRTLTAKFEAVTVESTRAILTNASNSASYGDEVYFSSNENGTDNLGTEEMYTEDKPYGNYAIAKCGSGRKLSKVELYYDGVLGQSFFPDSSGTVSLGTLGYASGISLIEVKCHFDSAGGGSSGGDVSYAEDTIVDGVLYIGTNTKEIADMAYYANTDITSVIIPLGVTKIGQYAFSSCPALVSVEISDTVTSIQQAAFRFSPVLKTITIGSGLTYIGTSAFSSCESLSDVYYSGTQEQWNSIENYDTTITKATIHYNSQGQ